MPGKSVLFERPPSVTSGEPLTENVVVQVRSEMLLQEQVENVRNIQDALQRTLLEIEHATLSEEQTFLRSQVNQLYEQSQEMVLVLKIMDKLNRELAYARAQLKKALKTGGNISMARKRVNWLQDRMETVLARAQQSSEQRSEKRDSLRSADSVCDDISRLTTPQEKDEAMSQEQQDMEVKVNEQRHPMGDMRTPESEVPTQPPDATQKHKRLSLGERKPSSVAFDEEANREIMYEDEDRQDHEDRLQQRLEEDKPVGMEISIPGLGELPEHEAQDTDVPSSRQSQSRPSSSSSSQSSKSSLCSSSGKKSLRSSLKSGKSEPIFITEASSDSPVSKHSRVTIQSPMEDERVPTPEETASQEDARDASDKYWDSEHHRFDYSEYNDVLLDINPLSYHQMGIALPGSFVEKSPRRDTKLPWFPVRKGSEITDIHKEALDKLAVKVNKMYQKVYEASMISVNPMERERMIAPTFMQNLDSIDEAPVTAKASLAKHGIARPSSQQSNLSFPPLTKERLGSSLSGRLVYHPKPLPYPKRLPLTTTTRSVEYPRGANHFTDSIPGETPAPERIVDQRNLLNETKFGGSLYRGKPQPRVSGTSEQRMQRLIQEDSSVPATAEQQGRPHIKGVFNVATAFVKLQGSDAPSETAQSLSSDRSIKHDKWQDMKPRSGALHHTGLKWERVKGLVHNSLESASIEEREDAARQLGNLGCCDTMVLYALRQHVLNDPEPRVVYESAKSMITLGFWEEEALEEMVRFLLKGNTEVRSDILHTMTNAKNVQFINKKLHSFPYLCEVLSAMCKNEKISEKLGFQAAVCLGKMCVVDEHAKKRLEDTLTETQDVNIKAQTLETLVRQMNCASWELVVATLDHLQSTPVWKHRKDAAKHIIHMATASGDQRLIPDGESNAVFEILLRKLWDDPKKEVRFEVAKSLAALGLFPKACERVAKNLEDPLESTRAEAVISVGTLGMKNERILRQLLEMIELDPSENVRRRVIQSFGILGSQDKRVIRKLREKEKMEGMPAREAKRSLEMLGAPTLVTSKPNSKPTSKR